MLRGNGEWLWRAGVQSRQPWPSVSFIDENPGDSVFCNGTGHSPTIRTTAFFYDKRPNLWVEPTGAWGRGAVKLVEIPTDQEIFDNIAAFWTPEKPFAAGQRADLSYRLSWGREVPLVSSAPARAVATRTGVGGAPGHPRPADTHKFVIDFAGGNLDLLPGDADVTLR